MSLSLSSLLNPSPDAESQQQQSSTTSPPIARKDSLPPIQYVQSPTQQEATSPHSTYAPQHALSLSLSYPPATESDAAQALAALSSGTAPPPLQSQWYGQPQSMHSQTHQRRSSSFEHPRPGSSGIQLPMPPPPGPTSDGKMSSPTLDQYHVASRSPEQRRPSLISPSLAPGAVLPPIQSVGQSHSEHMARPSSSHERADGNHHTAPTAFTEMAIHVSRDIPGATTHTEAHIPSPQGTTPSSSAIKQEAFATPAASSPANVQHTPSKLADNEVDSVKAITSLKNEHGLRISSPLRESSVPVQSTELSPPEPTVSKKRPAPARPKKGMATMKKAPPAKKRKIETKRSVTPSSRASKISTFKTTSSTGTPANSSPAPSARSQSDTPYSGDEEMDEGPAGSDDELYCICRKPDNGSFMIGCDGTCDDWFHAKCVGIEERNKNLIDKYICPSCTTAGSGRTTWKRMCRREGCRLPAAGKATNGKDLSKFCSDDCGVMFFNALVGSGRGKQEMAKNRSSRRKAGVASSKHNPADDDLGARGGVLAAGELKSLVNAAKTVDDFKKLGEGVLSPPSTPDGKSPSAGNKQHGIDYNDVEAQTLEDISNQKDEARRKHQMLKDRMQFTTMAKQAASRTATERELKPKEYCGYDSRIEWSDDQFALWRDSPTGKLAFELGTLATEVDPTTAEAMATSPAVPAPEVDDFEICDRKKCARHLEWQKLVIDSIRGDMADNGDHMRKLDGQEKDLQERAVLRVKGASLEGDGRVEVHGLGISGVDEVVGGEAKMADAAAEA